jgi:hypothetical protein
MTSVTRAGTRSALASAMVLAVLAGAAGCDSGDDIGGREEGSTSGRADDPPPVTTVITIEHGEAMNAAHQTKVVDGVGAVVDRWFEGAFLGAFPRSDFSAAFAGFTPGAATDAQRDADLMSNAGIADQIESAEATNRRVRLRVFAPEGHPRGVTAYFVLDFETVGDLEKRLRVHGALYLAKDKGEWKVFGYDVDEAVPL